MELVCTVFGWGAAPSMGCLAEVSCEGAGIFFTAGACKPCPEGGFCPGGSRVWPLPGYWSPDENSVPLACRNQLACLGSALLNNIGEDTRNSTRRCATGYAGNYCSECAPGYYMAFESCLPCPAGSKSNLFVLGMAAVVLYSLMAAGVATLRSERLGAFTGALVAFQQLTLIGRVAATKFAQDVPVLAAGLNYIAVLSFDVEFASVECSTGDAPGFITIFWATLVLTAAVAALFAIASALRAPVVAYRARQRALNQSAEPRLVDEYPTNVSWNMTAFYEPDVPKVPEAHPPPAIEKLDPSQATAMRMARGHFSRRIMKALLIAGTVLYFQICTRVFQGLSCTKDPVTGDLLLKVQLGVKCFQGEHLGAVPVMVLLLVFFCIGFPLMCLLVIFRYYRRGHLDHSEIDKRWGSMYNNMQPRFFWFKTLGFITTFIVTCVAASTSGTPPRLLSSGLLFELVLFLILVETPYRSRLKNVFFGTLVFLKVLVPVVLLGINDSNSAYFKALVAVSVAISIVAVILRLAKLCWPKKPVSDYDVKDEEFLQVARSGSDDDAFVPVAIIEMGSGTSEH